MTNFLEELYYGNVDPQRRGYTKHSHIVKVSDSINGLEEKLTERLQGEDKNLFLDFCNAYSELLGDAEVDTFVVGFRTGARFAYDTFCTEDEPFEIYLKE